MDKHLLYCKKLLAEFMGATVTQAYSVMEKEGQDGLLFYYPHDTSPTLFRNLSSVSIRYHNSWDWLMDVVKKVRSLGYCVEMVNEKCRVYHPYQKLQPLGSEGTWVSGEDLKDGVHKAMVAFVEFYNKNVKAYEENL